MAHTIDPLGLAGLQQSVPDVKGVLPKIGAADSNFANYVGSDDSTYLQTRFPELGLFGANGICLNVLLL